MTSEIISQRQRQVLHDKKWIKFLRRTWLFRHIPFVEFALAAGSLATGNVHEDSDFDVIIGARSGRIFTARFFSVFVFGFFGWRRTKMSHKEAAADKICLNHFVTEKSYRLAEPHSAYWKNLYQNLAPIYGEPEKINQFFVANSDWCDQRVFADDLRHSHRHKSWLQRVAEKFFGNSLGDWLERKLKAPQVARIEKSFGREASYKPRIIYNDTELEFHPDTRRTEQI
jgi:hypothetical protein